MKVNEVIIVACCVYSCYASRKISSFWASSSSIKRKKNIALFYTGKHRYFVSEFLPIIKKKPPIFTFYMRRKKKLLYTLFICNVAVLFVPRTVLVSEKLRYYKIPHDTQALKCICSIYLQMNWQRTVKYKFLKSRYII